jgi:hypothetical protein
LFPFFPSCLENLLFFEWRLPPDKRHNEHEEQKKRKEKRVKKIWWNNQGRYT